MPTVGIDALAAAASAGSTLMLLFDFDGTLSPTVSNPEQARLPTAMRHILADLAVAGCQLGVITSRSLADIQQRIDIPGVWLAGSGGLELWIKEERIGEQRMVAGQTTIAAQAHAVAPAIDRLPGAWLELKPLGLTIHHRDASPDTVAAVRRLAADLQVGATDVRVTVCTLGVEISPFPEVHKGRAVSAFVAALGNESPGLLYAGNDRNDAEAMVEVARHGGWVIGVGNDTLPAHTHVATPSDLCELLVTLGLALGRTMRG